MITARARYSSSSAQAKNGRTEKSTLLAFTVTYSAPKRAACSLKIVINSGPCTPSTTPGKCSTSVVNMSWPPGWSLVDDGSPSSTRGLRLARAVYRAAVWPAGPEPMISTSRGSATLVLFVRVGQFPSTESVLAGGAPPRQPPEQQSEGCEN